MSLPTTWSAFLRAATTTIAVPCWSSWKTGISSSSRSLASISKQRGAEMSSRLMPANPGAMALTVRTISSVSWVSRQIGNASMSAKRLKSAALPSITGKAASGPMLPRPRTAEPSVTTAMVFRLMVRRRASLGSLTMASQIRATPGVYISDKSSRFLIGNLDSMVNLPPRWARNVRSDTLPTITPSMPFRRSTMSSACSELRVAQVTSTRTRSESEWFTSSAVTIPPEASIALVSSLTVVGFAGASRRMVIEY